MRTTSSASAPPKPPIRPAFATPSKASSGAMQWVWIPITLALAALGSWGSMNAPEVYSQLNKPSWAPPAWLFGPVWSFLYLSMAVAATLVWRRRHLQPLGAAMGLYAAQLLANALWSWLFFAWALRGAAFTDSALLLVLLCATAALFWRTRKWAGVLMLPTVAWVSFATALSWAMWRLNP
jgi:translocator protein